MKIDDINEEYGPVVVPDYENLLKEKDEQIRLLREERDWLRKAFKSLKEELIG